MEMEEKKILRGVIELIGISTCLIIMAMFIGFAWLFQAMGEWLFLAGSVIVVALCIYFIFSWRDEKCQD